MTLTVAVTGLPPVFTALKAAILPVPLAAKPMDGVLLVQLNAPVPEKFTAAVEAPFKTVWFDTVFTVGSAFTVPATATFLLVDPVEASTTLPDIFPDAVAAERTYT